MSALDLVDTARHDGRHFAFAGRDYRWHHNGQRWTLQSETADERDERLTAVIAQIAARA